MFDDRWRRELARALLGAVVYGGWHAVQLVRLADWLRNGRAGRRPVARGRWREIHADLDRLQRRNRKKKRLASIIDRFRQVAAAAPDGAVVLHADDEIGWLNPAAGRQPGVRHRQDIGQPIGNLVRTPRLAEYLEGGDFERPLEIDSPGMPGVELLIRALPTGAGGGAALDVADTGTGIEERHLAPLTERFYRIDEVRSRDAGGTGLGLVIARHMLARHHAELRIASEPGRGSTSACRFRAEQVQVTMVGSNAASG